jgi:hypothetical protein
VSPEVAQKIAGDAFLTGVLFDGKDLRHMRRWTRNIPIEVFMALQLGRPPEFDGIKCIDCGKRFHPEKDHLEPHSAFGAASTDNLEWRCWPCHVAKTERDRTAGKLRSCRPGAERAAKGSKTTLAARYRGPARRGDRRQSVDHRDDEDAGLPRGRHPYATAHQSRSVLPRG